MNNNNIENTIQGMLEEMKQGNKTRAEIIDYVMNERGCSYDSARKFVKRIEKQEVQPAAAVAVPANAPTPADIQTLLNSGINKKNVIADVMAKTGLDEPTATKYVQDVMAQMTGTTMPNQAAATNASPAANVSVESNGTIVYTLLQPIMKAKGVVTDDFILEMLKLKEPGKPSPFVVERVMYNGWDGASKSGPIPMGQCKVIVRRKADANGFTMEDADKLIASYTLQPHAPKGIQYVKNVRIKDIKTNAPIPGAKVEIRDKAGKVQATYVSNHNGEIFVEHEGALDGWTANTVSAPKQFRKPAPIDLSNVGYTALINMPDIHIGLLAWAPEAGENYDLKIARIVVTTCVSEVIRVLKSMNLPLNKIIVATLGDLLHVDNDEQKTTKGTFQQVDGRLAKIYDTAVELMEEVLYAFSELAPVQYIYVPGNHDRVLGYTVARCLACSFKNEPAIDVVVGANPIKHFSVGKSAILLAHGDMSKKNLETLPFTTILDHSGIRSYYVCVGHLHSSSLEHHANGKVAVEHFDSLCFASAWEHQQGFPEAPVISLTALLFDGSGAPPIRAVGYYDPLA